MGSLVWGRGHSATLEGLFSESEGLMDLRKAIVLSRSKEGPVPIMTHLEALLSSDSFDLHLRTHTKSQRHLRSSSCGRRLPPFVPGIARLRCPARPLLTVVLL